MGPLNSIRALKWQKFCGLHSIYTFWNSEPLKNINVDAGQRGFCPRLLYGKGTELTQHFMPGLSTHPCQCGECGFCRELVSIRVESAGPCHQFKTAWWDDSQGQFALLLDWNGFVNETRDFTHLGYALCATNEIFLVSFTKPSQTKWQHQPDFIMPAAVARLHSSTYKFIGLGLRLQSCQS